MCGVGACARTFPACMGGVPQTCTPGMPGTETCNLVDDDCDGAIDEMLGTLSCGVGACARVVAACTGGVAGMCVPGAPATEICNSIDDDCDTMVDEGGVCTSIPPTVMCPATVTADTLSTVMLTATSSDSDGTITGVTWTVTSAPGGSGSTPVPPTSSSTSFWLDLAGTYVLTYCATDDDGNTTCCSVTVNSVPPELLRFELVWDVGVATSISDLDLHVLHPSAAAWTGAFDCYWANCTTGGLAWPPGGAAGNPSLDVDDVDGYGPENTNIDTPVAATTYRVGVHYYDDHNISSVVTALADVRVWCGGVMVYEDTRTLTNAGVNAVTNDVWRVADVTWVGPTTCTVAPLDTVITRAVSLTTR
jgi:hypothetical protein